MTGVADRARGEPLAQHLTSRPHLPRRPGAQHQSAVNSASTSEIAMNHIHPIRRRMWWAAGVRA